MKEINKRNIIERIIADKNLSANEIRIILFMMKERSFLTSDIATTLNCSHQYAHKMLVRLEKKNYIEKHKRSHNSKAVFYKIVEENILPGQTTIDDF